MKLAVLLPSRLVVWMSIAFAVFLPVATVAQDAARIIADSSFVADQSDDGSTGFTLTLTRSVPFRTFTRTDPNRLILDFAGLQLAELPSGLAGPLALAQRAGVFRPGWTRVVIDLAEPIAVSVAELSDTGDGVELRIRLRPVSQEDFDNAARVAENYDWNEIAREHPLETGIMPRPGTLRVAIDPGHGGVDPGAERAGIAEKDIAYGFAQQLMEILIASGRYEAFLTRDGDQYVSLRERVAVAHRQSASVFLSVHANTVDIGEASGAAVHVLSEAASDPAANSLALVENRADIQAGAELLGESDAITQVLIEMAQQETNARSKYLGEELVVALDRNVDVIQSRALRSADFRVLRAPDIPSVLIELGFLSDEKDRENMQSPVWRMRAALAVLEALDAWAARDAEATAKMRR